MKTLPLLRTLVCLALSTGLYAQAQDQERFQQKAYLIHDARKVDTVWIGDANKTNILYYTREQAVNPEKMAISKPQSIWLVEPKEYSEALELYQGRDYETAREKFAEVREKYKKLITLPDNHSSLAAFYELECLRKLGKYEELKKTQDKFLPVDRESLTRPYQVYQLDLNLIWEAVQLEEWPRLERIGRERIQLPMPKHQRVQVAYAYGLALDKQERPIEALDAYNFAMTADTGASEILASQAALNALAIYENDELVKEALSEGGETDENKGTARVARLQEAAATAALYQLNFPHQDPLPAEYEVFLKHLRKSDL